jgi:hypothetical protein
LDAAVAILQDASYAVSQDSSGPREEKKGLDYVEIMKQIVQCIGDARESLSPKQLCVVKEPEPEPRSLLESLEGTIQGGDCVHLLPHFGCWSEPWLNIGEEEGAGLLFI